MGTNSLTALTGLTLLLHAVFGCCWHHAHLAGVEEIRWEGGWHDHHAAGIGQAAEDACHEPHDHPADAPPHRHGPCDEDACVYLTAASAPVPVLDLSGWAAVVALAADLAAAPLTAADFPGERMPQGVPRAALRAALQVWLI